jgi:hypothetical protein
MNVLEAHVVGHDVLARAEVGDHIERAHIIGLLGNWLAEVEKLGAEHLIEVERGVHDSQ